METSLRPKRLDDYIGQEKIKEQMKILSDEFDRNMGAMRKNMSELIDRMTGFNEEIKDNGAKFLYRSEFTDGNDD